MPKKKTQAVEVLDQTLTVPRAEIARDVAEQAAEALEVVELVRKMTIATQADYEFACNALKECAQRHDAEEAKRKRWTGPLYAVIKDIEKEAAPILKAYRECERLWKSKIGEWQIAQEAERRRLVETASAQLQAALAVEESHPETAAEVRAEATTTLALVQATDVPKVAGVGTALRWTGEVLDAKAIVDAVLAGKLPAAYLTPNVDVLLAVTEAQGGDPGIPGWRAFQVADVRTSRRG